MEKEKGRVEKKSQRKKGAPSSSLPMEAGGGPWCSFLTASPSLNKLKPQNRALRSEQDSYGLGWPCARPMPTPTDTLAHPHHPEQGHYTQRASSQSGSVRVPASSHCRASSPMEGDEEVSQQGDSGGEG